MPIDQLAFEEIRQEFLRLEDKLAILNSRTMNECKFYRHSIPYLKTMNAISDLENINNRLNQCLREIHALNKDLEE